MDFPDLFHGIDCFLTEHSLRYGSLGFDLMDIDFESQGIKGSCRKLLEKMPQFGPLTIISDHYSDHLCLSNMSTAIHSCDETSIRYLVSRIPKPYNFVETNIYFRNVAFFGEMDPDSFVQLHRNSLGPQSTIVLCKMFVTDENTFTASEELASSLAACLGGVKYSCECGVEMTPEEETQYSLFHKKVAPIVDAAKRDIFNKCDDAREEMMHQFPKFEKTPFNLSTIIRRIGKQHGFTEYTHVSRGFSSINKKLVGGHQLSLEFGNFAGSGGYEAGLVLSGPGFTYNFPNFSGASENTDEAKWYINRLFDIIDYFENNYLSEILVAYPPAPDWWRADRKQ